MRPFLLVLCCAALGGSFVPNVAPSASRWPLGRDATCHVSGEWYASPCSASSFSTDPGPGPWTSRQMSAHAGDGGGGDTPGEGSAFAEQEAEIWAAGKEIGAVKAKIEAVEVKIEAVEAKIEAVEAAISGGPAYLGISDRGSLSRQLEQLRDEMKQLLKKEEQLRDEMKQLRDEMKQLRDETKQLRDKELRLLPTTALTPDDKNLTDFAAALTGAVVTNSSLELRDGTFFLGSPDLGSKLFIRPCYKELSEILLGGASKNMVVTGTPGIGKSVFGLYLLYLLRCEGKTVVFELKGFWYRFSDEGVQEGDFSDFRRAGYLTRDPTAWYLSDPKDRPTERFAGTTVVLVSPNYKTTKEFLKLPDAERVFMPVWDVDELLECQRSVFPHVPSTIVVNSFGVVGGVARAIFNEKKLELVKTGILDAADKVDVGLLRRAASLPTSRHRFQTDEVGDKLFHILSDSSDNFKGHTITFASEYTRDLVVRKIAERGRGDLLAFVGAAIGNPDVSRMLGGGSTVGNMFERAAHLAIGGHRADEAPFKMTILNGSEVLLGKSCLNFGFTGTREFEGKDIASTFDSDIYYTPTNQNFAAIDSFGVDSRDDTLYFFQVKYAGAVPVNGSIVERYWNTAFSSKGASVKNCVFVYVVPDRSEWNKTTKLGGSECWLPDASAGFLSACGVCVIEIPTG